MTSFYCTQIFVRFIVYLVTVIVELELSNCRTNYVENLPPNFFLENCTQFFPVTRYRKRYCN